MSGVVLTEAEVDAVRLALHRFIPVPYSGSDEHLIRAVEAIIAARLAPIEALADEWALTAERETAEIGFHQHHHVDWPKITQLRAALTATTPATTQAPAQDGERGEAG